MTYFLEDVDGFMLAPNGGDVDDLDLAVTFDTREWAENARLIQDNPSRWAVVEDVAE